MMKTAQQNALSELKGFTETLCPFTSVRIRRSPEWTDIPLTNEYQVTFELINDNILSAFPKGRISLEGTIALFENYDRFLECVNLTGKPYIEISDYSNITNIPSKDARLKVSTLLLEKIDAKLLISHFVYNVPKHIRWLYNIGTKFKQPGVPVIAYDTYEEAVKASLSVLNTSPAMARSVTLLQRFLYRITQRNRLDRYSEEILEYMGAINWNEPGAQFETIPDDHPFKAVFDALTILKTDIEQSFAKLQKIQTSLVDMSRAAGMAEVATGVLHNVGNVLNSVNVSCDLLVDQLQQSQTIKVGKLADLLQEHQGNLSEFLIRDARGRQVPGYLISLAPILEEERQSFIKETSTLRDRIDHIKEIVSMQQSYGRVSGVHETIPPEVLMEDALKLNAGDLTRHDITVHRDYQRVSPIVTDKHQVLQILLNLINNAKCALSRSTNEPKIITLKFLAHEEEGVLFQVIDNGVGITPENLKQIFQHGFTTRKNGHGFGLHSGAIAAKELGGSLTVHSSGPGLGATFTLELPFHSGEKA